MAHLEAFVSEIFLDLKRFTLGISANSMQIYSSLEGKYGIYCRDAELVLSVMDENDGTAYNGRVIGTLMT